MAALRVAYQIGCEGFILVSVDLYNPAQGEQPASFPIHPQLLP